MVSPEDQATFICYGICLLALVLVLGGLFLESRALQKRARESLEETEKKEQP
jgi:hypothetical protein